MSILQALFGSKPKQQISVSQTEFNAFVLAFLAQCPYHAEKTTVIAEDDFYIVTITRSAKPKKTTK